MYRVQDADPIRVRDSVSLAAGACLKFGVDYRAGANDEVRDRGSSGILTFSPLITSNLGAANTGNALASFMLGEVNAASVQMSDLIQSRASYLALYLQDDWRVRDRLTLNYGLRWEAEFRGVTQQSPELSKRDALNPSGYARDRHLAGWTAGERAFRMT